MIFNLVNKYCKYNKDGMLAFAPFNIEKSFHYNILFY